MTYKHFIQIFQRRVFAICLNIMEQPKSAMGGSCNGGGRTSSRRRQLEVEPRALEDFVVFLA